MGQYGIKIQNYSAGSIYEVSLGVRQKYDTVPAMLTNSLFKDFLTENGLNIYKNESTRDVICINFNYGSKSYEEEIKHLQSLGKKKRIDYKRLHSLGVKDANKSRKYVSELYKFATENKDKYDKKSADELRIEYYTNGVDIKYPKYSKKFNTVTYDTIHYKMLYRTPGKAKKGSCMFIRDSLYEKAHKFLWMGLDLPYENAPIVEIGAYSSLITSSIEDRVRIDPSNILVLKDFDSFFETNVVSIETDNKNQCLAIPRENYKVKNTVFDGQALIDTSIFPEWANGYVLLRQHFFKAAAFHTDIQKFFKDHFGDNYSSAYVTDMWGNKHKASDIKLITTDNAIKWVKFGVSYEYWSEWVRKNDSLFGIVKTAHPSKLGDKQRMSYQMVNALDMSSMDEVLNDSLDYIYKLKSDDEVFLDYLQKNVTFMNDYDVLIALVNHNPDFINCDYFAERRKTIINSYAKEVKVGHIIQNGDNLVLVGNPYAMLLHSVGVNPEEDPTLLHEEGVITCWTEQFNDGEYIAGFRSPFNSRNNMDYLHNTHHPYFDKYFKLGKQIVAVNCLHTDFQDRNNGSDFDSDTIYATNLPVIVNHAKMCYECYPTIVNNIPKEQNKYNNTLENFAKIDNKLSASQRDIGESSNLAQICLSYLYNDINPLCSDYVCILSVLAQVAIDSAKRVFNVNVGNEIKRIKREVNIKTNGYPVFWKSIRPDTDKSRINFDLNCPMNQASRAKAKRYKREIPPTLIKEYFIKHENNETRKVSRRIQELIQKYELHYISFMSEKTFKESEDYLLLRADFDDLLEDIRRSVLPNKYIGLMAWLLDRAFIITPALVQNKEKVNSIMNKNKALLTKVLFTLNPEMFLKCFKKGNT